MNDEEFELLDPETAGDETGKTADTLYQIRFPVDKPKRKAA